MWFDEEKLLVIEHTSSPLSVTAGSGSGKTRVSLIEFEDKDDEGPLFYARN